MPSHRRLVRVVDLDPGRKDLGAQDRAAGARHADQLPDRIVGLVQVHEHALGVDDVERAVEERHRRHVAPDQVDPLAEPEIVEAHSRPRQERRRAVEPGDATRRPGGVGQRWEEDTRATARIEDRRSGLDLEQLHRPPRGLPHERMARLLLQPLGGGARHLILCVGRVDRRGEQGVGGVRRPGRAGSVTASPWYVGIAAMEPRRRARRNAISVLDSPRWAAPYYVPRYIVHVRVETMDQPRIPNSAGSPSPRS